MTDHATSDGFIEALPVFAKFEGVTEAGNYQPLPDDWALALADVVNSTRAIEAGRYKMVNMAGAGMIAALLNALDRHDLPFVFGGDGAVVAFPASAAAQAETALAAVQAWTADELGLALRAAIVPVADIRAEGLDVRVARYQAAEDVFYAMLTGGGSRWAETQMKAGRYRIEPAPSGTRPDLTGLSCRWNPIEARRSGIVSIIATPHENADPEAFRKLVSDLLRIAAEQERGGHPLPESGPDFALVPRNIRLETHAVAARGQRFWPTVRIFTQLALAMLGNMLDLKMGPFDARRYRRDVTRNSDFQKFEDGLKMTLDIDAPTLAKIEKRLEEAEAQRVCRFGLHRQTSAMVTCIVVNPMQRDHIHFVDGASGGYATAAARLKEKPA